MLIRILADPLSSLYDDFQPDLPLHLQSVGQSIGTLMFPKLRVVT